MPSVGAEEARACRKSIPTVCTSSVRPAIPHSGEVKTAAGTMSILILSAIPSEGIQCPCPCVHDAGGLLYYDGANLNPLLGKVRPGDMGFDIMHINLHKTFSTPHGGGGPAQVLSA